MQNDARVIGMFGSPPVAQHGFYAMALRAHLRHLATTADLGTTSDSSDVARFVQGGVVKTFRCGTLAEHVRSESVFQSFIWFQCSPYIRFSTWLGLHGRLRSGHYLAADAASCVSRICTCLDRNYDRVYVHCFVDCDCSRHWLGLCDTLASFGGAAGGDGVVNDAGVAQHLWFRGV